jgi:hypothetical protein
VWSSLIDQSTCRSTSPAFAQSLITSRWPSSGRRQQFHPLTLVTRIGRRTGAGHVPEGISCRECRQSVGCSGAICVVVDAKNWIAIEFLLAEKLEREASESAGIQAAERAQNPSAKSVIRRRGNGVKPWSAVDGSG